MAAISEPFTRSTITRPQSLIGPEDQRVLILGYMASGSWTPGDLYQDLPNDGSEDTLFGANSEIAASIRGFKENNKVTKLDILPLDNTESGTRALETITFVGTATENGTVTFKIGSGLKNKYAVNIETGDTATAMAAKLDALLTADTKAPFVHSVLAGVVSIETTTLGAFGNKYHSSFAGSVAGVAVTNTGFTGGTGSATLTGILDPIAQIRYQNILWPEHWDITVINNFIDPRFVANNQLLDGVACAVYCDTVANNKAAVSTINQKLININCVNLLNETTKKGSSVAEIPDVLAAKIVAARSLRTTEGADLSGILTTQAPNDLIGGISSTTLPYFNTVLKNVDLPKIQDQYTSEELEELIGAGCSVIGPNQAGNAVIMGEQVSTELTDPAGNPDETFRFMNTGDSSRAVREFFFLNLKKRFGQSRLTLGDLSAGYSSANENLIKAYMLTMYSQLVEEEVLQRGEAQRKFFEDSIVINIDMQTGQFTVDCKPPLYSQIRVIINTNEVSYGA